MAVHYRTPVLILKKTDWGEADQLLTVYARDFGKMEVLGKAIRKIKSKLRQSADIFYFSELEFIQGKAHKTLTDAVLLEKFKNIRDNLEVIRIASRIVQILDDLIRGQEAEKEVWGLLNEVFNKLNNCKLEIKNLLEIGKQSFGESAARPGKLEIILHYFIWNFLSSLGYGIDLYNCVSCQKKLLPEKLYFDAGEGGIFCSECSAKNKKGREILPDAVKIIRLFLKRDWQTLEKLALGEEHLESLREISEVYLSCHSPNGDYLL